MRQKNAGFTLIEMLAVVAIISVLAGILIPVFSGVVAKAESGAKVENIQRANSTLEINKVLGRGIGDSWDSLMASPTDTAPIAYTSKGALMTGVATIDATKAQKLIDAGITQLQTMNAAPTDHTFGAGSGTLVPVSTFTKLPNIAAADVDAMFPAEDVTFTGDYVLLGVGDRNSQVGKAMAEAPICPVTNRSPIDVYSRLILVVAIPTNAPARLVGVLDAQFQNTAANLNAYYNQ